MQHHSSHQRKLNGTDEEERGDDHNGITSVSTPVYHGLTDGVMAEAAMRDATANVVAGGFSGGFSHSNNNANTTTGSFQLQPRGNQRPGNSSNALASANRGRKRRSGAALSSGGASSSSAAAPLSLVSFGPSLGLAQKSVVSPSDTPITTASSSAMKDTRDQDGYPRANVTSHRNYSEGAHRYLLESPGGVLGGALSNLALQSPGPSPSFAPPTHIFSHQVKSSPFSLSSSGGAAGSWPSSLLSPTGAFASIPPLTLEGTAAAAVATPSTSSGLWNQKSYSSSVHHETPPPKTAPLTVVTHTPTDRKRSPTLEGSFPLQAQKSPLTDTRSSIRDLAAFDFMASTPVASARESRGLMSSPNVTPLPSFALHPRGGFGSSGALRSPAFAPRGMFSPPRHSAQGAATISLSTSSRNQGTSSIRPVPSTPSGRMMMRPPMHSQSQTPQTPRTAAKKPSTPIVENCTPLTKSDVSFIPLPDWEDSDDSNSRAKQHQEPLLPPQPPRALSLLHTSNRPDPIDQMILMSSSFQNNHGNPYQNDFSNEFSMLDNESLSDDQDDNGFLLAAPREIEEERQQRSVISTSISSASEQHESRPSKHPRHGSRPSNNNEHEATEDDDEEMMMQEWADHLRPLPELKPPRTSSCTSMTVPTRDLVTPPAMSQSGSPPPLVPHLPEFH